MLKETYNHSQDARALRGRTGTQILHKHSELTFYINICVSLWEALHTWERTCKRLYKCMCLYKCICLETLISRRSLYMYKKTYICAQRPTLTDGTHGHASICVCFKTDCAFSAEEAHNLERTCARVCRVSHVNESCLWCERMICPMWMGHVTLRIKVHNGAPLRWYKALVYLINFSDRIFLEPIGIHTVIYRACTHTCRHVITPSQGAQWGSFYVQMYTCQYTRLV